VYAKTLTNAEGHHLIDMLRNFHPLNNDELIRALKLTFLSYKTNALQVTKTKVHVLQRHYDLHQHLEADEDEDRMERNCRYCKSAFSKSDCKCADRMKMWWEAASLVVLVQPSSAAAERVFSLLKNFWSVQQTSSLSDAIRASLFLAYNKRDL
jgi:hypothetical protein